MELNFAFLLDHICRWQMQLVGSSTSDGFLLARLSAGELGSEASAEPQKDEVRADKEVRERKSE